MVHIAGSLINGLLQSFQSIHALTGEEVDQLIDKPINNTEWCEYQLFEKILNKVARKHPDIRGVLFRAGIEFIRGWFFFGGGKEVVHSSIDFLHIQTDSQGYQMVVKAPSPEKAGWVRLENLEESKGEAIIHSTVPFPPDFTHGVFVGGLQLCNDLDYVHVDLEQLSGTIAGFYTSRMTIRFKKRVRLPEEKALLALFSSSRSKEASLAEVLYWKLKGLEQKIAHEKIYRDQLNDLLVQSTEEAQKKNRSLSELVNKLQQTQTQLIQQEKMASLGQLTAGVAHEINNPLNFMVSNIAALKLDFEEIKELLTKLEDLKKRSWTSADIDALLALSDRLQSVYLSSEITQLISGIDRGASRMRHIVQSLLVFSRKSKDEFVPADINEGIQSTLTLLRSSIPEGILIETGLGKIPLIPCQISRLNQVFLNLITNSIQAIEENGKIYIQTSLVDDRVCIKIQDTGKGMNEATIQRIFEPFYTTKPLGKGTGLGLSISYGIIEQHQGEIEVKSHLNKGTTFAIFLPVEKSD